MAPFASKRQQAFFHSPGAAAAGIKPSTVKEFDKATNFKTLPNRAPKRPRLKSFVGM